ncbi:MAG TPA: FG-GAP-like repeat-containing protein, partial [Tepidisphaeraceae bacterium]|nr:FG-GAP-like repeat-containing protein [Tepidisphaeraceae bacterium]
DDALPDIFAIDSSNNQLFRLVNNAGEFAGTPSQYTVGQQPSGLAIGDVNGDGIPDVVVANYGSDDVTVLTSSGLGLSIAGNFPAGNGPVSVAIGQLPGSPYASIAVADGSGGAAVAVLAGNGTGQFYSPDIYSLPGNRAGQIAIGDLSGDGLPDLAVVSGNAGASYSVNIVSFQSNGAFASATNYSLAGNAQSLVLADMNQDGKPDIVIHNPAGSTVTILTNTSSGLFFRPAPPVSLVNAPQSIAAGQLTYGGGEDLAVGTYSGVQIELGNGDGTFTPAGFYATKYAVNTVLIADVTGDGNSDVIFSYQGNGYSKIGVLLGYGDGTFSAPVFTTLNQQISTSPQAIAEGEIIPGDTADLAVATGQSGMIDILRGDGDGTFQSPAVYSIPDAYYADAVALGHLGGDGPSDIAVASSNSNSVFVLLSNAEGSFAAPIQLYAGPEPVSVATDNSQIVAADGRPRLSASNAPTNVVAAIASNGDGTFGAAQFFAVNGVPGEVSVADLNGDGNPDIVATIPGNSSVPGYSIEVLAGNSDGAFFQAIPISVGAYPRAVAIADFNGDGTPDIAVAIGDGTDNDSQYGLTVLLNDGTPSVTVSNGIITASGSAGDDTDSISFSSGMIVIDLDGTPSTFAASGVDEVVLNLGNGNDQATIGSLPAGVSASVQAGSGNDTITTAGSNETLIAGTGTISISASASASDDSLIGGIGNDTIIGGGPGSTLFGGAGDDILEPASNGELLRGGQGNDTLLGTAAHRDTLDGGPGDDIILDSGTAHDSISGGLGLNFAQYNSEDTITNIYDFLDPPAPAATPTPTESPARVKEASVELVGSILKAFASTSGDTIEVSNSEANLIVSIDGSAEDTFASSAVNGIKLIGGAGDNVLTVDSSVTQPATLRGGAGDDSLTGGGGDNVLIGNGGNDTLIGGGGTSLLIPAQRGVFSDQSSGNDSLVGGGGLTIADFSGRTDPLLLSNDGQPDSGDAAEGEQITIATSINAIFGGAGNDTIVGTAPNMLLSGGAGADSIVAAQAGDVIAGGAGRNKVLVDAEPVTLDLLNGRPDQYAGLIDPSIDILDIDSGLDSLASGL